MPCHSLTGFRFQRAGIEPDIVIDAFPQPETAGGMSDLPRCMPGAARGQFSLFQQDYLWPPTLMREVVGKPDPHHTTAYDDHAGVAGKLLFRHGRFLCPGVAKHVDRLRVQMYHCQS